MKHRTFLFAGCVFFCAVINSAEACYTRANFQPGYDGTASMTVIRDKPCGVAFTVVGYLFEGFRVTESPRYGELRVGARGYVYTPRKGYIGADRFSVEVNSGGIDPRTGVVSYRAKSVLTTNVTVGN
jgi:hypothetical protein